jgi:hypothetical protein
MSLSREAILANAKLPIESVTVEEWGGEIRVRALSVKDAEDYRKSLMKKTVSKVNGQTVTNYELDQEKSITGQVRLVILSVVDDQGNPLFKPDDEAWLKDQSLTAIGKVANAANKISGLTNETAEDAAKNSEPNPSDTSSSD